jgi:hypothetical protein
MCVVTDEAGVDFKVAEELPRDTGIFSGHNVRLTEDTQRPDSDVLEVTDWRCDETKTPWTRRIRIQGGVLR